MADATLHQSAFRGHVQTVEEQLSSGAAIDELDPLTGDTPLLRAIEADSLDVVRLLLTKGADPNRKSQRGESPLHRAVDMAVEVANDIYDRTGRAAPASLAIIEALLKSGADPSATDSSGRSPADWARRVGFEAAVKLLHSQAPSL